MKELLKQIRLYSKALEKASQWDGSKESLSAVEAQKKKKNGTDYIYEFFCYLTILVDLQQKYDIQFVKGSIEETEYVFPKAPALKKGWPYFIAKDKKGKQEAFQICAGTKVKTGFKNPEDRAPDISFQKAGTKEDPVAKDVYMIFDAKFNRPKSAKDGTDQGQFSFVSQMIRDLNLVNAPSAPIKFDKLAKMLGNCIITNGDASNSDAKRNQANYLKEVENFSAPFDPKKINIIG